MSLCELTVCGAELYYNDTVINSYQIYYAKEISLINTKYQIRKSPCPFIQSRLQLKWQWTSCDLYVEQGHIMFVNFYNSQKSTGFLNIFYFEISNRFTFSDFIWIFNPDLTIEHKMTDVYYIEARYCPTKVWSRVF